MFFPIYAYVAVVLLIGVLSTRLMRWLKLPNVTGYILTGVLVGPFVLGFFFNGFSYEGIKTGLISGYVKQLGWVSTVALGFIAFTIGSSFKLSTLKVVGKRALISTVFEACGASLFVFLAFLIAHFIVPQHIGWELVLTLAAIASATAPAATLMVIHQYRARGELVETLLPVVALDDAAALILFAILFQVATGLSSGEVSLYKMLAKPFIEIGISIGFGAVIGFVIAFINRFFHSRNNKLILCIFSVFAALSLYVVFRNEALGGFELSSLLMCMVAGLIYTNLAKQPNPTLDLLDRFTSPLYMVFFVLSGANLDLTIFAGNNGYVVLIVAATYVLVRVGGKYLGAFAGSAITHTDPKVRKYLGLALAPQAGVAIGLATTANQLFSESPATSEAAALILAVVLTSTLVYELVGPLLAKLALKKAGAIPSEE